MKKLVLAMLLTVTGHLLFDMYHAEALAGSVQGSATTRLLTDLKNPTEGTLALEQSGVRLGVSLGNDSRLSMSVDLMARSKDGFYIGAGLVGDRVNADAYVTASSSDTVIVLKKHDHGKHKGDTHKRGPKGSVTNQSSSMSMTILGEDYDVSPSILLGVSAKHGLFVESRVIFGGPYDAENRTSVGIRF
jgi:hypothetical protein